MHTPGPTPTPTPTHMHTHVCYSLFQVVQKPFPVCTSFPNLLANNSSSKEGGFSMKGGGPPLWFQFYIIFYLPIHAHTHTVPMCASLSSQSGVQQLLRSLLTKLKSTNVRRFPAYASSCLDQDSLSELLHSLATMADNYQTESCPEEDSDSDD